MSAPKKINRKIGIIAGGGDLPRIVADTCSKKGHDVFIAALKGQCTPQTVEGFDHIWSRLGAAGSIMKALKKRGITDICMIGNLEKPTASSLIPDLKTAKFLAKNSLKVGDDALLKSLRRFLEEEGFTIKGTRELAPQVISKKKCYTKIKPDGMDIKTAMQFSKDLGAEDKGQSVIVKNGECIAEETQKGTSNLIKTHGVEGSILVKTAKPNQDMDLDLPTIGLETVRFCAEKNMAGIIIEAGTTQFLDREKSIALAHKNNMFIVADSYE